MAINLGGGGASAFATLQLSGAQEMLSKSLMRLSSGLRITTPSDDPGGLAVSMRLNNSITITKAVQSNVENAKSFTDTQDSALESIGNIVDRMSTIKTSYDSVVLTSEKLAYATEFKELSKSLAGYMNETFNGISLFGEGGKVAVGDTSRSKVYTSASQLESGVFLTMGNVSIRGALTTTHTAGAAVVSELWSATQATGTANDLSISDVALTSLSGVITNLASVRAEVAATSSRLGFASDFLGSSRTNLESAYGRIMDVDIAEETTNYAKYNLQVYAASAALAQSNLNLGIVLDLLKSAGGRS
ncbi:MAG: flagellin [Verrucomicrobia bacterium]|nr:flagellin [Verrucomicrobiota bacterium]MDA1048773.1 flagellin [Verrucomicrobiota bacterium]